MDSVTQAVLGGTVTYAVLGRKIGKRAMLYGAALGTLPDLDVFIDFGGPVENMTYHRGVSHSFFVQLLVTPILAWLMTRFDRASWRRWCVAIYLCFVTHTLADMFTVYGTQMFWPFTDYPFAHAILFIVDPIYTLPLIAAFIGVLVMRSDSTARKLNASALIFTTAYLVWSLGAKAWVDQRMQDQLAAQGIQAEVFESSPAPLTTLLWRGVAVQGDQYFELYTSVFDRADQVSIRRYPRGAVALAPFWEAWRVERLRWFTKGQYSLWRQDNRLYLADLRMGSHGAYVFNFEVARQTDEEWVLGDFSQVQAPPRMEALPQLFKRILDPSIEL